MCLRVFHSPHLPYLNLYQTRWKINAAQLQLLPQKACNMISTWHRLKKLAFGWQTYFIQINMFIEGAISKYANKLVIFGHATSRNIFLVMVLERYRHLAAKNCRKKSLLYIYYSFLKENHVLWRPFCMTSYILNCSRLTECQQSDSWNRRSRQSKSIEKKTIDPKTRLGQ